MSKVQIDHDEAVRIFRMIMAWFREKDITEEVGSFAMCIALGGAIGFNSANEQEFKENLEDVCQKICDYAHNAFMTNIDPNATHSAIH